MAQRWRIDALPFRSDIEPQLLQFSADADWARLNGVQLEHYNLAQQPMAFADKVEIKSFLECSGADSLPLILLDGELDLAGRYPQRAQLARRAGVVMPDSSWPFPA